MAEPIKRYRVTLTYELEINEIDQDLAEDDVDVDHLAANQAMVDALLNHPELKTNYLPSIIAGRMSVQTDDIYALTNIDVEKASGIEERLAATVSGTLGERLREAQDAGYLYEYVEPYLDSIVLAPVAITIDEVQ